MWLFGRAGLWCCWEQDGVVGWVCCQSCPQSSRDSCQTAAKAVVREAGASAVSREILEGRQRRLLLQVGRCEASLRPAQ